MRIEAYYFIGLIFVITFIVTIAYKLFKRTGGDAKTGIFNDLYSDRDYNTIVADSNQSHKRNKPFIEEKDVMSVIDSGIEIVGDNLFQNVGKSNGRPKW